MFNTNAFINMLHTFSTFFPEYKEFNKHDLIESMQAPAETDVET